MRVNPARDSTNRGAGPKPTVRIPRAQIRDTYPLLDKRFHLDHPFEHGHFEHFGPSYRYTVVRIDRDHHRFWFPGGVYFEVAPWDWSVCADWCWDCGDDFVVYEDPDHPGWYLLYNVHTGHYVYATYLGA